MELQEFIENSLLQICHGIKGAKHKYEVETGNCPIAPATIGGDDTGDGSSVIFFDIGVTISKGQNLNVSAGVFGVGAKGEVEGEKQEINRLQFSIPFYPQCVMDRKYLKNKEKS